MGGACGSGQVVNEANEKLVTELTTASEKGDGKEVERLLDMKADIHGKDKVKKPTH